MVLGPGDLGEVPSRSDLGIREHGEQSQDDRGQRLDADDAEEPGSGERQRRDAQDVKVKILIGDNPDQHPLDPTE